jgi:hypothetical protein
MPVEAYVSYLLFEVPAERSKLELQCPDADAEDHLLWGLRKQPAAQKGYPSLGPRPGFASSKSS